MEIVKVNGEDKGNIMLYALSTCVWCKKAKKILDDLGVAYSYLYVDLLKGDERESTVDEVKKWNSACSFPTLVFKNETCVVGSDEQKIKEAIGL
jgi:glutaredoxin-like protein NrdH